MNNWHGTHLDTGTQMRVCCHHHTHTHTHTHTDTFTQLCHHFICHHCFDLPFLCTGSVRRLAGPVPGSEMGRAFRPGRGGCAACSAGPGGAGWHHAEVHLPRAEAGEEDRGPAININSQEVQKIVLAAIMSDHHCNSHPLQQFKWPFKRLVDTTVIQTD